MNRSGNFTVGAVVLLVFIIFMVGAFATIEPFKEFLNEVRGNPALNCPGTESFNATDYADDSQFEKNVRRPTCFVTGVGMVWFVGAFMIAASVWLVNNWKR